MEPTKHFEDVHKATLDKLEDFMKSKPGGDAAQQEKVKDAKDKWQSAWNEFLETLVVLEKLEI